MSASLLSRIKHALFPASVVCDGLVPVRDVTAAAATYFVTEAARVAAALADHDRKVGKKA